jgi:ATP-dependent DNA helicase RecQ
VPSTARVGVLLPAGESDQEVWDWFATATLPDPEMAERLLQLLRQEPMKTAELVEALARSKGKVEVLLKQLRVDGGSGPQRRALGGHRPALAVRRRQVRPHRRHAPARGRDHVVLRTGAAVPDATADRVAGRSRLRAVWAVLGLHGGVAASRARAGSSGCGARVPVTAAASGAHHAPQAVAVRQRAQGEDRRIGIGRAITGIDGGVYPELVEEAFGPDASLSPELREAFAELLARWRREDMPIVTAVVPVPSATHPVRVRELAELAGAQLGLPVVEVLAQPATVEEPVAGSGRLRQVTQRLQLQRIVGAGRHGAVGRRLRAQQSGR